MHPCQHLPVVLDRAMRIVAADRTVTAIIIPSDVQDLEYVAPAHEFKMAPGSIGTGARNARAGVEQVAEPLGAGVAKALLGKDVLSDELAYVTNSIGLLGAKTSYDLMMGCGTLLTVGSSFPYTQLMPEFGKARGVQIDIDPTGPVSTRCRGCALSAHRAELPVRQPG